MKYQTLFRYLCQSLFACAIIGSLLALQSGETSYQEALRESESCLECHDGMGESLLATAHALDLEAPASDMRIACTDCHAGDSRHWEDDPEAFPMLLPSDLKAAEAAAVCGTCHMSSHQQSMLERNPHGSNGINCSACHSVHEGVAGTASLQREQPQLCYSCHQSVEGQFARPSRHPVSDGTMDCTDCHTSLDETRVELSRNGTNVCTDCHAEFQGPFPFQHPAALDFGTEEAGCLACHDAHGSDHQRMLEQPYESPHFQLCTQCHGIPPLHNSSQQHGTQWMGQACNTCHGDIHGSYTNRFFLSETLTVEGCLDAGCHGR
jgi:DmsE family decaheme c-type cytochrome